MATLLTLLHIPIQLELASLVVLMCFNQTFLADAIEDEDPLAALEHQGPLGLQPPEIAEARQGPIVAVIAALDFYVHGQLPVEYKPGPCFKAVKSNLN